MSHFLTEAVALRLKQHAQVMKALKKRTGRSDYGSRVEQGRFQLVSVTYGPKGKSTVKPESKWLSFDEFVAECNRRTK